MHSWREQPTLASQRCAPAADGEQPTRCGQPDGFAGARERFETILSWLDGDQSTRLDHGELERRLDVEGPRLLRQLLQDHLDPRSMREIQSRFATPTGNRRSRVETGHTRGLATIFGQVTVTRLAYREPGLMNLHPADAVLNLPVERHSHGLRQLAAIEASSRSFHAAGSHRAQRRPAPR